VLEALSALSALVTRTALIGCRRSRASIASNSFGGSLVRQSKNTSDTNALFYIDHLTGNVLWKLNGTAYNKDGSALIRVQGDTETAFSTQHDARFEPNGDITLFDDHGAGAGVARGIEYAVDHYNNVATPVFQVLGLGESQYVGGFRRYADGESVISWGYDPIDQRVMTEVDASGNDVLDIAFDGADTSYRAVKVPLSQLDINLMRQTTAKVSE
jgi:hypothetical protein